MESEVSGIAKLGIVLIALAVLIGLGFGIFQISKGTANTGVNNVQGELDGVAQSAYTTYDQTTITGTMARSCVSDFEGEPVAVVLATQAWINLQSDVSSGGSGGTNLDANDGEVADIYTKGSGFNQSYTDSGNTIPVVFAYASNAELTAKSDSTFLQTASDGSTVEGSFINYNAILGNLDPSAAGTTDAVAKFSSYLSGNSTNGNQFQMGGIYFDTNCFKCTSGLATDTSGKTVYNNITGNLSKTGRTEFLPTGAKFSSYLIKDASGTTMGIALQQVSNG